MGIIFYLFPFSQTALTKTTRNPKLYFYDTGLACFLTKYKDAKTLIKSQYAGHIFECYVISEINKGFINNAHNPLLYYIKKYGTDDIREREIDLIVEGDGGIIYPIEIKANMTPKIEYFRHLKIFDNLDLNIGPMTLICMVQNIYSFGKDKLVLPVH
jgi:predicted AAA+ superfamily ATPase